MTPSRTDSLPEHCPKCGAPTFWLTPKLVQAFGIERLQIVCRCGFVMTCKPNDARQRTEQGLRK